METKIDLSKALVKGIGNAIVIIEPTIKLPYDKKIIIWCQATNLGVDVLSDNEELVAFVTDLKTGKPISDAQVEIYPDSTKGESDTNGIVRIPFTSKTSKATKLLLVRKGDHIAFLPEEALYYGDSTSQWVQKRLNPIASMVYFR